MNTTDMLIISFSAFIGGAAMLPWALLVALRRQVWRLENANEVLLSELSRERQRTHSLLKRLEEERYVANLARQAGLHYNGHALPPPPDIGANYAATPAVRTANTDSTPEARGAIAPAAPSSAQQA